MKHLFDGSKGILWSTGAGSDVMKPIVLLMIGGVFSSAQPYSASNTSGVFDGKEFELRKHGKIDVLDAKH